MDPHNVEILKDNFNWITISDVSENEIFRMAEKLEYELDDNFLFKCTWSYYRKCTVFSLNKVPLLFLKYVREHYIEEILAIHMTKHFLDPELCFEKYLTGFLEKKKTPIPFIMTTYEMGDNLGRYNIHEFKYLLGRQCYLHEILCLYDVYERHFIVRNRDSMCRIDYGRAFENLQKDYLGFSDFLKNIKLDFNNIEFQSGYLEEREIIKNNLDGKVPELFNLIQKVKTLKDDPDLPAFHPKRFCTRLIEYWERIGFLKELNISDPLVL